MAVTSVHSKASHPGIGIDVMLLDRAPDESDGLEEVLVDQVSNLQQELVIANVHADACS